MLKIITLLCWGIGIGIEFLPQKWPKRKVLLNIIAAWAFALALGGEYLSNHYDEQNQSYLKNQLNAIGTPVMEWFHAKDAKSQIFTIRHDPLLGSLEVDMNGLEKPADIYSLRDRAVTVSTPMDHTDQVTIKYRYTPR